MRITQGASLHANWVSGGDSVALCNVRGASDSFEKMNIRPGSIWHKLGPKLSSNYFSFLAFGITRGRADNRMLISSSAQPCYETVREGRLRISKRIWMDGCSPVPKAYSTLSQSTSQTNYDGGSVFGRTTTGMRRRDTRR